MGRGRPFLGYSLVPPKGIRWAPKPNAFARCVGNQLHGKDGGGSAGVRERFIKAVTETCKGKRG